MAKVTQPLYPGAKLDSDWRDGDPVKLAQDPAVIGPDADRSAIPAPGEWFPKKEDRLSGFRSRVQTSNFFPRPPLCSRNVVAPRDAKDARDLGERHPNPDLVILLSRKSRRRGAL